VAFRTILILDQTKGLITDEGIPYYMNEKNEKIIPSSTSSTLYLNRGTNNVVELKAEIALLKKQLRKALK